VRMDASDAIAMAAMSAKRMYDRKHDAIYFNPGEKVLLRLYKGCPMPSSLAPKYSQQYVGPFEVKRRVGRLAYELHLPPHWAVHPVFSVAHLESTPSTLIPSTDLYLTTQDPFLPMENGKNSKSSPY